GRARARELHDTALARRIGGREAGAKDRHHRPDIDDLAAPGLLHVWIGGMRTDERASEIGIDHGMPLGGAQCVGRLADVSAGIIDENIEAAMTRRSLVDQTTAGGFVRHIDLVEFGFTASLCDALHSCFALFGIAPGEYHDSAGRRETFCHTEPHAAIAARAT